MQGAIRLGTEFLVNTQTAGHQNDPTIANLANGGFVVSWNDNSGTLGDASGSSIKAQVFAADGSTVGTEFLVATQTANNQDAPNITGLTNGGFVVSWSDGSYTLGDVSGRSIKAQVFAGDGTKVGTEFLVNTQTEYNQQYPAITGLANGGFVVSWQDNSRTLGDSSSTSIKAQVFAADGSKLGSEFLVNTQTASNQDAPTIASLTDGGFVASWTDKLSNDYSIKAQIFAADGTRIGTEFLVNTQTRYTQQYSTITGLTNGGFVISWEDNSSTLGDTSSSSIKAQVFAADGSKVGTEFLVNTQTGSDQVAPTITGLTNGGIVVSWQDNSRTLGDSSSTSIRAQVFAADGTKAGSEFLVNTQTAGWQGSPTITGLTAGGFVVSWLDQSGSLGDSDGNSIKAQVFVLGNIPVITSTGGGETGTVSLAENDMAVTTIMATDADAATALTYSISGGADASLLQIDATTGALSFKSAPNFEAPTDAGANNVYNVIVQVSDGSLTDTQALTITVTNVNDAPAITSNGGGDAGSLSIAENTTKVATITATDVDANPTLRFAIVGGADAAMFQINSVTGELSFEAQPNFEAPGDAGGNNIYDVTVTVSDGSLLDAQALAVTVTDVGNQIITGTPQADNLIGDEGDDRLYGGVGMDELHGQTGNDRLYGEQEDDRLYGETGNDDLYGGYDDDALYGDAGNDKLYGEAGNDRLEGGTGNDILDGGIGADTMIGGAGSDTYYVDEAGDVIDDQGLSTDVDAVMVLATVQYTLSSNIENATLDTESGDAGLTGNGLGNDLTGNGGHNTLAGGAGNDIIDGGAGNDKIDGGSGNDFLVGGAGNDTLTGGTGTDTVDLTDAQGNVSVDLVANRATGDGTDTLSSIENAVVGGGDDVVMGNAGANTINGGNGNDKLTGGAGDDVLVGGTGGDTLYAGDGDDTVIAGAGDDVIVGGDGAGNDRYTGGTGVDTIRYTGAKAGIRVDLSAAKDQAMSIAAGDAAGIGVDQFSGIENVIGGNYADRITGNGAANVLRGLEGNDVLNGAAGSDRLIGGTGRDSLRGGIGADGFVFDDADFGGATTTTADRVLDFSKADGDRIDLKLVDANTANGATDNAFTFIGTKAFSKVAGELRAVQSSGNTFISGDTDGNGTADFMIRLDGLLTLTNADFVL